MEIKKLLLAAAAAAFLASAFAAEEAPNLLRNGDLSETDEIAAPVWVAAGWVFSKWNLKDGTPEAAGTKWGVVKDKADPTKKCLWISTSPQVKAQAWWQQEAKCEPGESYVLSFKAKGSAEAPGVGPGCGFYLLDPSGKWLLYQPIKDVELSPEWKSYTAKVSVSDDTAKLGVRLGIGGSGAVEIFFSDIKLAKASNPAP